MPTESGALRRVPRARLPSGALLPRAAPGVAPRLTLGRAPRRRGDAPAYLARDGFIPRRLEDFGDGGAFPEIHVAQFPMEMGRKKGAVRAEWRGARPDPVAGPSLHCGALAHPRPRCAQSSSAIVSMSVNAEGEMDHAAVVAQHGNRVGGGTKGKRIYSSFNDLVEKDPGQVRWAPGAARQARLSPRLTGRRARAQGVPLRPGEDEAAQTAERTRQALEKIVDTKIKSSLPCRVDESTLANPQQRSQYVKYTPANAPAASRGEQRVIRMVEAPVDPMEPPRHKHIRVSEGACALLPLCRPPARRGVA